MCITVLLDDNYSFDYEIGTGPAGKLPENYRKNYRKNYQKNYRKTIERGQQMGEWREAYEK